MFRCEAAWAARACARLLQGRRRQRKGGRGRGQPAGSFSRYVSVILNIVNENACVWSVTPVGSLGSENAQMWDVGRNWEERPEADSSSVFYPSPPLT